MVLLYQIVAFTATSILSVISNALVILVVGFTPSLRTATNLILVSLSMADLQFGALYLPMRLSAMFEAPWTKVILYCQIEHGFLLLNQSASMLNVTLMALDRYASLYYPFVYQRLTEKKWLKALMIGAIWFVCIFYAFSPALGIGSSNLKGNRQKTGTCGFHESMDDKYLFFSTIFIFLASLVVVTWLHIKTFMLARRHMINIAAHNINTNCIGAEEIERPTQVTEAWTDDPSFIATSYNSASDHDGVKRKQKKRNQLLAMEIKALKVIATVIIFLYICWLPIILVRIIYATCKFSCDILTFQRVAIVINFANSFLNPVIYFSRYSGYREALKRLFKRFKHSCFSDT